MPTEYNIRSHSGLSGGRRTMLGDEKCVSLFQFFSFWSHSRSIKNDINLNGMSMNQRAKSIQHVWCVCAIIMNNNNYCRHCFGQIPETKYPFDTHSSAVRFYESKWIHQNVSDQFWCWYMRYKYECLAVENQSGPSKCKFLFQINISLTFILEMKNCVLLCAVSLAKSSINHWLIFLLFEWETRKKSRLKYDYFIKIRGTWICIDRQCRPSFPLSFSVSSLADELLHFDWATVCALRSTTNQMQKCYNHSRLAATIVWRLCLALDNSVCDRSLAERVVVVVSWWWVGNYYYLLSPASTVFVFIVVSIWSRSTSAT